jgi:hypothetical protein
MADCRADANRFYRNKNTHREAMYREENDQDELVRIAAVALERLMCGFTANASLQPVIDQIGGRIAAVVARVQIAAQRSLSVQNHADLCFLSQSRNR